MFRYEHFHGPNMEPLFKRWDHILTWYEAEEADFEY